MRAARERIRPARPAAKIATARAALTSAAGARARPPSSAPALAWPRRSLADIPVTGETIPADRERQARHAGQRWGQEEIAGAVVRPVTGPLPSALRAHFEPRLGFPLGNVRLRADTHSAARALSLGARAFTARNEIDFGDGEYRPDTVAGRQLIAHELIHVIQQSRDGSAVQCAPKEWTSAQIDQIQRELVRLGLLNGHDGRLGARTEAALTEAYGGDSWHGSPAPSVLSELKKATPPSGPKGEHRLRWGEMFKDGVLDMTLGIGFDEGGSSTHARDSFVADLTGRGFAEKKAGDKDLVAVYARAGRAPVADSTSRYFLKPDALVYKPPVGAGRKISVVVRLVYSLDGSEGKQVAEAFKTGMVESDIAYYSGHGRYGSGPDFDRNYRFRLFTVDPRTKAKKLDRVIDNYTVLRDELATEGAARKPRLGAWQQFERRVADGTLEVIGSNEGNVYLNPRNPHPGEFGAKLMFWNLARGGGKGAPLQTGRKGPLAKAADARPEKRYRVIVFDGCRSEDYNTALRATPHFDTMSMDEFGSSHELMWGDEGGTLAAFLDAILKMQSAEEIARGLDDQQKSLGKAEHPAYHAYGVGDNPVNR
jgi:hypothetical protein